MLQAFVRGSVAKIDKQALKLFAYFRIRCARVVNVVFPECSTIVHFKTHYLVSLPFKQALLDTTKFTFNRCRYITRLELKGQFPKQKTFN